MNFDESVINKSDVALEPWKMSSHNSPFFNSGPLDFIGNGGIDARCNKDAIIIYCTLALFL